MLARFQQYRLGDIGVSSVVAAESAFGGAKSGLARNRQALKMFLAPLSILSTLDVLRCTVEVTPKARCSLRLKPQARCLIMSTSSAGAPPMTNEDSGPFLSPLSRLFAREGETVQVDIYEEGEDGWILEVVLSTTTPAFGKACLKRIRPLSWRFCKPLKLKVSVLFLVPRHKASVELLMTQPPNPQSEITNVRPHANHRPTPAAPIGL